MAPPSSTSFRRLRLSLFLVLLAIAAGPTHGAGARKSANPKNAPLKNPTPKNAPPKNVAPKNANPKNANPKNADPNKLKNPMPVPIAGADIETNFKGSWAIDNPNVGVAAMQFQLMPNNKAVWFDTTSLGPSARELGPPGNCPKSPEMNFKPDCFAHAIAYDVENGQSRTIYVSFLFIFVNHKYYLEIYVM